MSTRTILRKPFNQETAEADLLEIQKETKKIVRRGKIAKITFFIMLGLYFLWIIKG